MGYTKSKVQVAAGQDLSIYMQPVGSSDIICHFGGLNDLADAKRFEVCVNAMDGIDDPAAFVETFREMAEALSGAMEWNWLDDDIPGSVLGETYEILKKAENTTKNTS